MVEKIDINQIAKQEEINKLSSFLKQEMPKSKNAPKLSLVIKYYQEFRKILELTDLNFGEVARLIGMSEACIRQGLRQRDKDFGETWYYDNITSCAIKHREDACREKARTVKAALAGDKKFGNQIEERSRINKWMLELDIWLHKPEIDKRLLELFDIKTIEKLRKKMNKTDQPNVEMVPAIFLLENEIIKEQENNLDEKTKEEKKETRYNRDTLVEALKRWANSSTTEEQQ